MKYLTNLQKPRKILEAGVKAENLHWLHRHGFRIPYSYVIPYSARETYLATPLALLARLHQELDALLQQDDSPSRRFAVRSSANLEDTTSHSYAGQFATILNVDHESNALLQAVQQVFEASNSNTVRTYAMHTGQDIRQLKLAVIIQEMVNPLVSGVAFSKNPLTGLDEVIVEALPGSGEQLVQAGKTPDRWVYKWGNYLTQPEHSSVVPGCASMDLIQEVISQTQEIARQYGAAVDLEWVYDGQDLYWVQVRPITRLDEINIYSNRIAREVFPGLIKPLIWSINVPLVNGAWIRLFTEMIGRNDLYPEELSKSFYYHAYFNMGVIGRIFQMLGFPRESLELLMGFQSGTERPRFKPSAKTVFLIPRLLRFALAKVDTGRKLSPFLVKANQEYTSIAKKPVETLDNASLLSLIDSLYKTNQETAYFNIIIPLLMGVYNALFSRQLQRYGLDIHSFDLMHGINELDQYDPNFHLKRLAEGALQLDGPVFNTLASGDYTQFLTLPGVSEFKARVEEFITLFGHLSDSGNDFSAVPWRETPGLVLQMIAQESHRLGQHQEHPHHLTRSHLSFKIELDSDPEQQKYSWSTLPLNPFQRLAIRPFYQRAHQYRLHREAVSSTYTFGYGQFRRFFLELGRRLVELGVLSQTEDVFFLEYTEIKSLLEGNADLSSSDRLMAKVQQRQVDHQASQGLVLPELIFGDEPPPLHILDWHEKSLQGIPSSRGYYRGPAKVIQSVADFNKLDPGDVLVIPYSDVSWTPLFTQAGAVIAESGGILSHSSIVAREFNLPCVVSVPHACQIPDMTIVSVDGFKGIVTLETVT